jgi:hypothetical protein
MTSKDTIDWNKLLLDIRNYALMSMREISERTDIPKFKLWRISSGGSYKIEYHEGVSLISFHNEVCKGI